MPYSLVLNLLPKSAIPKNNLSGRHLHALFLELVQSVDAELATILHQQTSEKAFTLSPLQVIRRAEFRVRNTNRNTPSPSSLQFHPTPIAAGTSCWWRISLLDDRLFSQLTHLWLNLNPQRAWHLGAADLQVVSILGTPQANQPWANAISYVQLYEQASESDRRLHLSFCTPTTFRQTQYDCAMPMPEFVFQSLLKRWNRYSGIPFPTSLIEPIYPSYFNIQTEIVTDSRSKLIGCIGEVTYQILGDVAPEQIKQINALADFTLYAGVGRKTPMGMGMARRTQFGD